jgi:hypothetical protein
MRPLLLSEELAAFVGAPAMARGQVTKFFWSYFKDNGLQVGGCWLAAGRARGWACLELGVGGRALAPRWPGRRRGSLRCAGSCRTPAGAAGVRLFLILHRLSSPAASPARPRRAQDPRDKRNILSDERLLKLVGVKSFAAFSLAKLLKGHFLGPAEGEVAEAANAAAAASRGARPVRLPCWPGDRSGRPWRGARRCLLLRALRCRLACSLTAHLARLPLPQQAPTAATRARTTRTEAAPAAATTSRAKHSAPACLPACRSAMPCPLAACEQASAGEACPPSQLH